MSDFLDKLLIYSERSQSIIADRFVSIRLERLHPNAISVNGLDRSQFVAAFVTFLTADGYVAGTGAGSEEFLDRVVTHAVGERGHVVESPDGRPMFVMYARSRRTGTTYVAAIPMSGITSEVASTRDALIMLMVAVTIVSLIAALLLAHRQANPVQAIRNTISRLANVKDVTYSSDFINRQVAEMLKSNMSLQHELRALMPLRRTSILHSLINGEYRSAEEIAENLQSVGIRSTARRYALLIVLTNETSSDTSTEELTACKLLVRKAVESYALGLIGILDVDFDRQVVLIGWDQEDTVTLVGQIETLAGHVVHSLARDSDVSVSFAGSITHRLQRIPDLYREAKEALSYTEQDSDRPVLWYRGRSGWTRGAFRYSIETEIHLTRALVAGDVDECNRVLAETGELAFAEPRIDQIAAERLFGGLATTMGRLTDGLPEFAAEIMEREAQLVGLHDSLAVPDVDPRQVYEEATAIFVSLCACVHVATRRKSNPLAQKITAYLQENFTDPQLSLGLVAREFGITDIYLSRLFKEQRLVPDLLMISGESYC